MKKDPQSFVGVAMQGKTVLGVVSGTLDEGALKARLLGSMSVSSLLAFGARLVLTPKFWIPWFQSLIVAMPLEHHGRQIRAVLTALAVSGAQRGRGIGRELVGALEGFYRGHGVGVYRLDTLQTNVNALGFYRGLGFQEVARRAGSVVLTKVTGT